MPLRSRPFRAEREFGLVVGGIFAAIGGWWTYRERFAGWSQVLLGAGTLLFIVGLLRPSGLAAPRRLWMQLAEAIGAVVTFVILALVFFVVVTPIGVVKRLSGWDPLGRRAASSGGSFWHSYSSRLQNPRHFEKMF